jgi:hypothetical protein
MTKNNTSVSYISWKTTVDRMLSHTYVISIEDAGIDDDQLMAHWSLKESPKEFVEWFGAKYDLQSVAI